MLLPENGGPRDAVVDLSALDTVTYALRPRRGHAYVLQSRTTIADILDRIVTSPRQLLVHTPHLDGNLEGSTDFVSLLVKERVLRAHCCDPRLRATLLSSYEVVAEDSFRQCLTFLHDQDTPETRADIHVLLDMCRIHRVYMPVPTAQSSASAKMTRLLREHATTCGKCFRLALHNEATETLLTLLDFSARGLLYAACTTGEDFYLPHPCRRSVLKHGSAVTKSADVHSTGMGALLLAAVAQTGEPAEMKPVALARMAVTLRDVLCSRPELRRGLLSGNASERDASVVSALRAARMLRVDRRGLAALVRSGLRSAAARIIETFPLSKGLTDLLRPGGWLVCGLRIGVLGARTPEMEPTTSVSR